MALHVGGRRKQVFQTPAFLGLIALNLVGSQLHSPFFTEAQGDRRGARRYYLAGAVKIWRGCPLKKTTQSWLLSREILLRFFVDPLLHRSLERPMHSLPHCI